MSHQTYDASWTDPLAPGGLAKDTSVRSSAHVKLSPLPLYHFTTYPQWSIKRSQESANIEFG